MSFAGLILFIVILLPVISNNSDRWLIRNPADTNTFEHHDQCAAYAHPVSTADAALLRSPLAGFNFAFQRLGAPIRATLFAVDNPAFYSIQNRPPPLD